MEHLTKQQVILLALLVSFVTSIATGIVTVSLVNQAPAQVTQTINRVVEKTIERVVPAPSQGASVITKETVVVKADDAVVSSVEKGTESLVRVKKILSASSEGRAATIGLGLIISKNGLVVADRRAAADDVDESGAPIPRTFFAELLSGEKIPLSLVGTDAESGVALFRMVPEGAGTAPKGKVPPLPPLTEAVLGNSLLLKLGQTVIALGGESDNAVSVGIVSSIAERSVTGAAPVADVKEDGAGATAKTARVPYLVRTDVRTEAAYGSILLTLSGEVVAMKLSVVPERGAYIASSVISEALANIQKSATRQ